jgi:hypothetical protein
MGAPQGNKTQKFAFDKKEKLFGAPLKHTKNFVNASPLLLQKTSLSVRRSLALLRVITKRFLPEKFHKDNYRPLVCVSIELICGVEFCFKGS